MAEDPLGSVYSYVEKAYIRLQAGDLLNRCLDESSEAPIQQMIEGLVLAGPQNLPALKEILAETEQRRSQVDEDIRQLMADLEKSLKAYGVNLSGTRTARSIVRLTQAGFLKQLRQQGVIDESTQIACLQILKDSRDLMISLVSRLKLLEKISVCLQDWLWGLTYQSVHQDGSSSSPTLPTRPH